MDPQKLLHHVQTSCLQRPTVPVKEIFAVLEVKRTPFRHAGLKTSHAVRGEGLWFLQVHKMSYLKWTLLMMGWGPWTQVLYPSLGICPVFYQPISCLSSWFIEKWRLRGKPSRPFVLVWTSVHLTTNYITLISGICLVDAVSQRIHSLKYFSFCE